MGRISLHYEPWPRQLTIEATITGPGVPVPRVVTFLVDTGSWETVLSGRDARSCGIDVGSLPVDPEPSEGFGNVTRRVGILGHISLCLFDDAGQLVVVPLARIGVDRSSVHARGGHLDRAPVPSILGMDCLEPAAGIACHIDLRHDVAFLESASA